MAVVQQLVVMSADLDDGDYNGQTPLFRACEAGHTDVGVALLGLGACAHTTDINGRTSLHVAALGGSSSLCDELLCRGLQANGLWCLFARSDIHNIVSLSINLSTRAHNHPAHALALTHMTLSTCHKF